MNEDQPTPHSTEAPVTHAQPGAQTTDPAATRRRLATLGGLALLVAVATLVLDHQLHDHHDDQGAHGTPAEAPHADHDDDHARDGEPDAHEAGRVRLTPDALREAGLQTLVAGPGHVAETLELPGEVALNAQAMAHVTPLVAGTVRAVHKQLGDAVKKGDVLADLDSRELAELQRQVVVARERLTLAERNFQRERGLWQKQISAEKDYLSAKQALAEAQIEHRSATDKLKVTAGSLRQGSSYQLVAPIDGTIIENHIDLGELLQDDAQAFVIADLSSVWVQVAVHTLELARVGVGQVVRVRAEGIDVPAEGTVTYVGPVLGEATRSATARVVLRQPGSQWRPGLFVTAEIAIGADVVPVVVAADAIQVVAGKASVFVEEDGAFEAHPVRLGRRRSAPGAPGPLLLEVVDGLPAGARYVGKGSFLLKAELGKADATHEH